MKKVKTFDSLFWISLIIFLIVVALICFFPFWLTSIGSKLNFTATGQIGDTIGGTMGPFVAIAASILTFLAFWVQYKANLEQKIQFEKQNQDQLFFRLIDSQESKIINSSFKTEDNIEISGFQLPEHIVHQFKNEIRIECRLLAREIVRNDFEKMSNFNYYRMFEASSFAASDFENEKKKFINDMTELDKNDRWEYIKMYFGSLHNETPKQIEALETIGTVAFYKVAFDERVYIYNNTFQNIEGKFASFLDSYYKGCELIAQIITQSQNKDFFIQYFSSQLTKFEKILLFYYIASGKRTNEFIDFVKDNKILGGIYNGLLIDAPSNEELNAELNYIFNYTPDF